MILLGLIGKIARARILDHASLKRARRWECLLCCGHSSTRTSAARLSTETVGSLMSSLPVSSYSHTVFKRPATDDQNAAGSGIRTRDPPTRSPHGSRYNAEDAGSDGGARTREVDLCWRRSGLRGPWPGSEFAYDQAEARAKMHLLMRTWRWPVRIFGSHINCSRARRRGGASFCRGQPAVSRRLPAPQVVGEGKEVVLP